MKFINAKTPWLAKKAFPSYVWDVPSKEKVIYLTFDDGPTPIITEKVLKILAIYNAKATFFCIGKNIVKNPAIYQQVLDEDHAIGNHTYNHLKGWNTTTKDYLESVLKTDKVMSAENSVQSEAKNQILNSKLEKKEPKTVNQKSPIVHLFRPPYGKLKPSQGKSLQKLGYKIIMWDVLAIDWDASVSKEEVLQNIIDNTKNGSIVVLHDSLKASKNMLYVLPKALDYFSKKGFSFKSLNNL